MRLLLLAALVAAPGLAACDADGDWSATKEGDRIVAEVMAGTDSWSADDVTVNGVDLYPGSRITNAGFDVSTSGGGGQLSPAAHGQRRHDSRHQDEGQIKECETRP